MMRFLWQHLLLAALPFEDAGGGMPTGGGAPGGAMVAPGASASIAPTGGDATPGSGAAAGGDGAGASPAWAMPDGFPDALKSANADEFMTKLTGDWKRQRDDIAGRPVAAKDVADYVYEPSDKARPFVGDVAQDPVVNMFKAECLKAGMPAAMFGGIMGGLMDTMAEKGLMPKPYDAAAERKAFLGADAAGLTDAQAIERIGPQISGAVAWLDGLKTSGALTPGAYRELGSLLDSGEGLRAVLALQKLSGAPGLQPGGSGPAGGTTRADLKARQADPRNDSGNQLYDKGFAEETDRLYKAMFK